MIEITESAVRQLRTLVGAAAEKGLRIGIAKGGCSGLQYEMTLGAARPGDAVIERDGVKFFVDQESAQLLRGSTLDYRDALPGFAFVAWLGSFYVFWQPERPDSYRLLKKLHRIDPPRRFELTAAPAGEFLNPKQLHDRYAPLGEAELSKTNSELARNYIRNFQQVHGLVPYVVGRFRIIDVHQLGSADIFTSGMVALAAAIDNGEVLLEHV